MGCQSTNPVHKGTTVGGLTGGAIGAVVGTAVDKPVEGAAIGAGVGAIAGAAVGHQEQQRDKTIQKATIDTTEVVSLVRAGVSPSIIIQQVNTQGVVSHPTTDEILFLQQNGVPELVISALQTAPLIVQPVPAPTQAVVVQHRVLPRAAVVVPRIVVPAHRRRGRRFW